MADPLPPPVGNDGGDAPPPCAIADDAADTLEALTLGAGAKAPAVPRPPPPRAPGAETAGAAAAAPPPVAPSDRGPDGALAPDDIAANPISAAVAAAAAAAAAATSAAAAAAEAATSAAVTTAAAAAQGTADAVRPPPRVEDGAGAADTPGIAAPTVAAVVSPPALGRPRVGDPPPTTRPAPVPSTPLTLFGRAIRAGRYRRLVVLTGAGVSTAAGVPDFRSPTAGLYDCISRFAGLDDPTDVFCIDFFRRQPAPFFALARQLWPSAAVRPTRAHRLGKALADRGLLRRLYTQNIDGLDRAAGLHPPLLIEAHGSFATASCIAKRCGATADVAAVRAAVDAGTVPRCEACGGLVKHDIVFFGEPLPPAFHAAFEGDARAADAVLVMGTSLRVQPVALLPELVRSGVPRVLLNRDPAGDIGERPGDVLALGDIESLVVELATACGWAEAVLE